MGEKNENSCIQRIREVYSKLNNVEKRIAKSILENPRDIIHFSITELADCSSASEATVSRLCRKLGYKGYQDLKINLASSFINPIENIHQQINKDDDAFIVLNKLLDSSVYSLENTMKMNRLEEIERSLKLILKADQIMFFGMGGSRTLAYDAYHKFIRTGIRCVYHTDSHWQAMFAAMSAENDVVMAFSNSGSNKDLAESLEIAKNHGAKVILITGNAKSPLVKLSDVVLISYGSESMYMSEAMESRISVLFLIDCLYVLTAMNREEDTLDNLKKIREGIAVKRF